MQQNYLNYVQHFYNDFVLKANFRKTNKAFNVFFIKYL